MQRRQNTSRNLTPQLPAEPFAKRVTRPGETPSKFVRSHAFDKSPYGCSDGQTVDAAQLIFNWIAWRIDLIHLDRSLIRPCTVVREAFVLAQVSIGNSGLIFCILGLPSLAQKNKPRRLDSRRGTNNELAKR